MKLDEFLKQQPAGTEVTVHDSEYDTESYFYNDEPTDAWDQAMWKLASLLTVLESDDRPSAVVDLSELIEGHLESLESANLFKHAMTDDIMDSIESIISGYVSEEWFVRFVNALAK